MKIRHFIPRGGRRFYWQPSNELRACGWRPQRLPDDLGAAVAKAEALNAEVDAWRRGEVPAGAPPAVQARAKRPPPGTVSALIEDYRHSRWWAQLAPSTRRGYEWALDAIEAWAGDQLARAISAPAVQAFYLGLSRRVEGRGTARRVVETPAKAAAAVRVLRLLLQVGVRLGYRTDNPASRPGISLRRRREPVLWTDAMLAQMVAAADRLGWYSLGTAMALNAWIGQREGDVLALPPWQVEAEALVIRQRKTGRRVSLPVYLVPQLVARLRAAPLRGTTHLLVHDRSGRPWNADTFRHVFADVRKAAAEGLPATEGQPALPPMPACAGLRFMELRHTAVTRLHEAGVEDLGIAGITGHTPGSVRAVIDRHYLVRTEAAAADAFRRRIAAEATPRQGGQD